MCIYAEMRMSHVSKLKIKMNRNYAAGSKREELYFSEFSTDCIYFHIRIFLNKEVQRNISYCQRELNWILV
jgi:hypothetical protein